MFAFHRCRSLQIAALNRRISKPKVNITFVNKYSSASKQSGNQKLVRYLPALRITNHNAIFRNGYQHLAHVEILSNVNYCTNPKNYEVDSEAFLEVDNLKSLEQENEIIDEGATQLIETASQESAISKKAAVKKNKSKKQKTVNEKTPEELKKIELLKAYNLQQNLKSYLNMCFHHGFIWKVLPTLKSYEKELLLLKNCDVYNIVLKGAARNGDWIMVQEIRTLMEELQVSPDVETYAACFACLGACSSEISTVWAEKLVQEMESKSIALSDIFDKCLFAGNEREVTLDGIHLARPDFVARRSTRLLNYSTKLLDKLNDLSLPDGVIIESPAKGVVSSEQLTQLAAEQFKAELVGAVRVRSIAQSDTKIKSKGPTPDQLEIQWRQKLNHALTRDLAVCKTQFNTSRSKSLHIYPYLSSLSVDDYTELLLYEVKMLSRLSDSYSPSISLLSRILGSKVMKRFRTRCKEDNGVLNKLQVLYAQYCEKYLNPGEDGQFLNPRQIWQKLIEENDTGPDVNYSDITWPSSVLFNVGQFLYNIIINEIKIPVTDKSPSKQAEAPAFYIAYRTRDIKLVKQIKPHPQLIEMFQEFNNVTLDFETSLLPMVSPPLPWYSTTKGAYLVTDVPLIRIAMFGNQQLEKIKKAPYQQMYPSLDSLNFLGTIPWKINTKILDLLIQIFNEGGSDPLEVPRSPNSLTPPETINSSMTPEERTLAIKERKIYWRRRAEMYSIWCDTLYRISLANHFRDKVFWLPNNMDFRGRVYPCPPHLSHLSSDMARSILHFAKGKPLGKDGFNWLKTHVINLTGFKKHDPVSERLCYAEKMMDEIMDSALNPLSGNGWWLKSDEPWQTLAACMEVAAAVQSPDPHQYVSHLPVHQDGSCNGLQHYAALGRDQGGAESVNLAPADRPQDVYSNIAVLVEKERAKDAENGIAIAKILEGHIKRKVVKQTVMTTVYGVTRYGARAQIHKQLKDRPNINEDQAFAGASYLADKTFSSLREMFTAAKEIQDWFTFCAKSITGVFGKNVEWVTPLGLPVVQPYTSVSSYNGQIDPNVANMRPNSMKQRNAFPPNFVHSLDSSHMMLTSLFCQRSGITFASVHDCFWTHASTVPIMNRICREQFVALHSEPILEDLSRYLLETFASCDSTSNETIKKEQLENVKSILAAVPKSGSFDLNQVMNSVYFFS